MDNATTNAFADASSSNDNNGATSTTVPPSTDSMPPPPPPPPPAAAHAPPAPTAVAMAIPALAPKSVAFEGLNTSVASDVPYATAQPTPGALPPIAMARPVHATNQHQQHHHFQSHNNTHSNIPVVNGQPHVAFTTDGVQQQPPFVFMDATRKVATAMLVYYIASCLFFQPFVLGVVGLMTAFMGFYGARPPMDAVRMKWIRSYLYLNYVLVVFNVVLLGMTATALALHTASTAADATLATDSNDTNDSDYYATYAASASVVVVVLLVLNVLLHVRAIQTARAFYGELEAANVQFVPPTMLVVVTAPASVL